MKVEWERWKLSIDNDSKTMLINEVLIHSLRKLLSNGFNENLYTKNYCKKLKKLPNHLMFKSTAQKSALEFYSLLFQHPSEGRL